MGWVPAGPEYEVSLEQGKVVSRNAQGKRLKVLPKALKEHEAVGGLRQLADWLKRHEISCRAEVEQWMVRSLPVPSMVLCQVWQDETWRGVLEDLVVVPVTDSGVWQLDTAGLLRDADEIKGLGIVNLEGESARLQAERIAIPHPVRLPDLGDLREFATDLGVRQGTLQLFREVWEKPGDEAGQRRAVRQYAGAKFKELRHVQARATSLGYRVQGGTAALRSWEDGRPVVASVWIGEGDPGYETETGDLFFADAGGQSLALNEIGPVAWSEGMRMAAALHAGRVTEEEAK